MMGILSITLPQHKRRWKGEHVRNIRCHRSAPAVVLTAPVNAPAATRHVTLEQGCTPSYPKAVNSAMHEAPTKDTLTIHAVPKKDSRVACTYYSLSSLSPPYSRLPLCIMRRQLTLSPVDASSTAITASSFCAAQQAAPGSSSGAAGARRSSILRGGSAHRTAWIAPHQLCRGGADTGCSAGSDCPDDAPTV